jgi:hypothetical protein
MSKIQSTKEEMEHDFKTMYKLIKDETELLRGYSGSQDIILGNHFFKIVTNGRLRRTNPF